MTLEKLINEIVSLDKQIEADIETVSLLEKDSADFEITAPYEERIDNNITTQNRFKNELACRIVEAYTGYKLLD